MLNTIFALVDNLDDKESDYLNLNISLCEALLPRT